MFELGYSGLTLSALPYAFDGVTQIFLQVLQPYIQQGNLTTSSTPVTANANPTLTAITVASLTSNPTSGPTTMVVGDVLIVDQGIYQERSYIETITGNVIGCMLQNPHVGTYPVTVESGESLVRACLRECVLIAQRISNVSAQVGIKKADEVEFYASTTTQRSAREELLALQKYWRDELGVVCGLDNLRSRRPASSGGSMMTNY